MLTTCPECRTTFRVTQEHLGLRRGLVRCGSCGVVFNAYDSLLAELVAPPDEPGQAGSTLPDALAEAAASEPIAPVAELAVADPAAPTPSATTAWLESTHEPPTRSAVPTPAAEETSESILLSELPTRIKAKASARQPLHFLKILAAPLLGGLLVGQLALFQRTHLAAALPATRPFLQALCRPLGCTVPLPRQLGKSAIASSSLEHDAENKSRASLSLLLANRSDQAQTWPHIILTLTDVRDAPVAQRIFSPGEYLAAGAKQEDGMAARSEREIRLDLDTGTLEATGYSLDLAYR